MTTRVSFLFIGLFHHILSPCGKIRDKLDHQLSLARKMQLVDAVQEIAMQENDKAWMSAEFAMILNDQETIR